MSTSGGIKELEQGLRVWDPPQRAADFFHIVMILLSTKLVVMSKQMALRHSVIYKSIICECQTAHTSVHFSSSFWPVL